MQASEPEHAPPKSVMVPLCNPNGLSPGIREESLVRASGLGSGFEGLLRALGFRGLTVSGFLEGLESRAPQGFAD